MPTGKLQEIPYDRRAANRLIADAGGMGRGLLTERRATAFFASELASLRMARVARPIADKIDAGETLTRSDAASFSARMRREIATANLAATRVLLPGEPSKRDRERLDAEIQRQYQFLDGFLRDLREGGRTGAEVAARASLYGSAVWGVAQEVTRGRMADDGYGFERSCLAVTEHCPSCIDRAVRGWSPIGTLPRLGDSECRARCKCTWLYRRTDPDAD